MEKKLTREEKRSVRKGKAYKSYWRFMWLGLFAWILGCVLLVFIHLLAMARLPEIISVVFGVVLMFSVWVFCIWISSRGWHCPQCGCRLPRTGLFVPQPRTGYPVMILRCPKCNCDLTDGNLEALDEHTKNTGNMIVPNSSDRYDLNDK